MSAAFPYLLAGSAGVYAAAIYAYFTGRWHGAASPEWWLLLPAVAAFAVDRSASGAAFVAAPITFVCCALLCTRMLAKTRGARAALWFLLAAVPIVLALVIAIDDFLPQHDADRIVQVASWLLTLPALAACAACAARVILRSPQK